MLFAFISSTRDFQNRILSGSPSRSVEPGNSCRKKSASSAPKDFSPFGFTTALSLFWNSSRCVSAQVPDLIFVREGVTDTGRPALVSATELSSTAVFSQNRRSSAISPALWYRSTARRLMARLQIRCSSTGTEGRSSHGSGGSAESTSRTIPDNFAALNGRSPVRTT